MLSAEQIKKDYETFRSLCGKLGERSENVLKMVDYFEERLVMCPASSRDDFHMPFAGSLLNHSLRVASNLLKLNKTFELNFLKESMILTALFHDWGKIGDLEGENYLPVEEDWKLKRGIRYDINKNLKYMTYSDRTLFLLQEFNIKLNQDEFLALRISDGPYPYENKPYNMKEVPLAVYLFFSDRMACEQEKVLFEK